LGINPSGRDGDGKGLESNAQRILDKTQSDDLYYASIPKEAFQISFFAPLLVQLS